jgi:defect in organelle trafficking protein DotA
MIRYFYSKIVQLCVMFFGVMVGNLAYSADSSLSFTPPAGDYSVVFLEDVFGVVDGVLSGTGSQIMGSMFSVFNAAVLALGGIVIMYILIVGTLNTAQEGTMLGQKWNSLWIPVRATLGLALLMPKASGYCLMQIFVMWVIVQGVGAADKLWDAALNYLNNGGVIIQAQINPAASLSTGSGELAAAAAAILANQVCMVGLQTIMDNQRQMYANAQSDNPNICTAPTNSSIAAFCGAPMPNLLATFDASTQQQQQAVPPGNNVTVPLPYFETSSPYYSLTGLCGSIVWQTLTQSQLDALQGTGDVPLDNTGTTSTATETTTTAINQASLTPAIALQQMYVELGMIATSMASNDPQFVYPPPTTTPSTQFTTWANEQYGVAYTNTDVACTSQTNCISWGLTSGIATALLFHGTEFQDAIAAYNAVMAPTLNLINENNSGDESAKSFITQAETSGWLTAGSYYYNLIALNGSATAAPPTVQSFPQQQVSYQQLTSACQNSASQYSLYCDVFGTATTSSQQAVVNLIQGTSPTVPLPSSSYFQYPKYNSNYQSGMNSSTTLGYIYNAAMITLPGQPGVTAPSFMVEFNIAPAPTLFSLKQLNFPCGNEWMLGCVGAIISTAIYDGIIQPIFLNILSWIDTLFEQIVQAYLYVPMSAMGQIFVNGEAYLNNPGANPIISLAQMGTAYINYAMELWIQLISASIVFVLFPGFAMMMAFVLPILMSWLGVMVTIGFATAYYVPFVPYILFIFGVIAWLMAVIEAMVGAPIVALGITHPDGDGLLGNGEQGIMLLLNVFLRPAMMVLGYMAGISVCYVGIWIMNTGYQQIAANVQPPVGYYSSWAGLYGGFMAIVMYTSLYMILAQKSFNLIYILPDKVLRWIKGGQAEDTGSQTSQWGEESKNQMKTSGEATERAGAATTAKMATKVNAAIGEAKPPGGGTDVSAS